MKKTHLPVAIVASLLLTGHVWSADVPMVAYLYSTYRPGMDSVHDETFAQLGWGSHKWRNLHVRQLTENLDRYDMVLCSMIYNLADPQDFKPYRARWLAFLEGGGVIVVAGPQDTAAQWDWIPHLGEDYHFTLKTLGAFQKYSDWTNPQAVLDFGLVRAAWAHFSSWSPKWTVTNHDANGKPIVMYQQVGKGLIVVATTYWDMFTRPQDLSKIWSFARRGTEQSPLEINQLSWGSKAFGSSKVDFTVRNRAEKPIDFRAVLRRFNGGNPPASVIREVSLDAGRQVELSLPYSIVSGDNEVSLVLDSAEGRVCLRRGTRYGMPDVADEMRTFDSLLGEVRLELGKLKDWPAGIVAASAKECESLAAESLALTKEFAGEDVDYQSIHDRAVAAADRARALKPRLATWAKLDTVPAADQQFLAFKTGLLENVYRDREWAGPVALEPDVELAANEYESFQLVILPLRGTVRNVRVTCSDLESAAGASIRDVEIRPVADVFVDTHNWPGSKDPYGWHPDVLLTVDSFNVSGDCVARGVWITVHTQPDTPAGVYSGVLTVSAAGAPPVKLLISVKVWAFAVPHKRNLPTQFYCRANRIAKFYFGEKAFLQYWKYLPASTYRKFLEYLLKYRIAAYPYDDFEGQSKSATPYLLEEPLDARPWEDDRPITKLDFTDYDKHMQLLLDYGNDFVMAGTIHHRRLQGENSHANYWKSFLPIMYEHLKEKGWDKKAFIYGMDEAQPDKGHLPVVRAQYDLIKKLAPPVKYLLTYTQPGVQPGPDDPSYADIWVPHIGLAQSPKQLAAERAKFGQSVWTYTCWNAFYVFHPMKVHRAIFWRVWRERYQGFLYFCTAFYWDVGTKDLNPDGSPKKTFLGKRSGMFYLICPASGDPEDGPNATFRLEAIRDGLEDWEYFHMLSNLIEQSAEKDSPQVKAAIELMRQIDAGTGPIVPHTRPATDPMRGLEALRLQRKAVAQMIERLRSGR